MRNRAAVVIVGAGPSGLVLGNLLVDRGIDTVILERSSRERIQSNARAGFFGPNSVRVLTEHGLGSRMTQHGRRHGLCAFRDAGEEFTLRYGEFGAGQEHVVYPQHDLVADLISEYLDRGGQIRFDTTVTEIDAMTATAYYSNASGTGMVAGVFLAGCDGGNSVARHAVPASSANRYTRDHKISWLAILAEVPQSMTAVTYATHENGFAGHMARSPNMTRYYLQVPPDDTPEAWCEERVWAELRIRMCAQKFGKLHEGAIVDRRIVRLRSEVIDPIQHGRMFLVGDAASRISPAAAKGANLAIMEAEILANAMIDALEDKDNHALHRYSRACLPRIWRAQEFSQWMINLLNIPPNGDPDAAFQCALRRARLESLRTSRVQQDFFAENYVCI